MLYEWFLRFHNIFRWVFFAVAAWALVRALAGWSGRRPWTGADQAASKAFPILLDIQFLMGLVLYTILSPLTQTAIMGMPASLKDPGLRFFAVEHPFLMVVGWAVARAGSIMIRRAPAEVRHRRMALWFGIALVLVLLGIPWDRPLFR